MNYQKFGKLYLVLFWYIYACLADAPEIDEEELDISVIEGIQFSLQCQNEADPAADLTWQPPRGQPIIRQDAGVQGNDGYRIIGSSLIVERSSVRRHFGRWFCTACNKHGCATASRQVTVQGERQAWKPLPKMQYICCTYRIFLAAWSAPIAEFIKN